MNSTLIQKRTPYFLLIFIILYPWLFNVFQGIYIAELGYWLVSYEHFFDNPTISQTTFYSWLTTFIGATVNYFFGSYGVISFKIANIFTIYLILFTVYKSLFSFISKTQLLFFLLTVEIVVNSYYFINYYSLTTLFFTTSILFLYFGLSKDKLHYILLASFFLGLNIFIRFPNLLGFGFMITIIYYNYAKHKSLNMYGYKQLGTFLLGYVLAILVVLLLMKVLGHFNYYLHSISDIISLTNGDSAHGSSALITTYFTSQFSAIKEGAKLFFLLFLALLLVEYFSKHTFIRKILTLSLFMSGTYYLLQISGTGHTNYIVFYNGIIGFTYIMLVWILFTQFNKNINLGVLALMALIAIEIIPFGSATVLHQAKFGLYLAIPLIFTYLLQKDLLPANSVLVIHNKSIKILINILGLILIAQALIAVTIYHPPGLENERWTMTHSVDHPHLKANFMSKEKADTLNELICSMHKYSEGLTYILTYEGISTVNYLSDLQPYLNNTYPFFMPIDKFDKELIQQQQNKSLPMVVRAKTFVSAKGWPTTSIKIHQTSGSINTVKIRKSLDIFLKTNHYISVWHNKDFEILIPPMPIKK